MKHAMPYYLAGQETAAGPESSVLDKFTGEVAYRVHLASSAAIDAAIAAAQRSFSETRKLPSFRRQAILQMLVQKILDRREDFARTVCIEAGKPIRDARGEVDRLIDTLRIASEEAVRNIGEFLPLDISPRSESRHGIWRRVPIGPCAFITPFNFPLNLVAHKIAPAIAMGCPFILKPASATPVSALMLGEILAQTDWPKEAWSILPCPSETAELLVVDERIKLLSFTGSPDVGWRLKSIAGQKKISLELGGNAACIIDKDIDVDFAAERLIIGAFYQSGQSCISVQRILIHTSIYESLKSALLSRVAKLKSGDPKNEDTFIGPLIAESDAKRIETWVHEAKSAGARILCGGCRNGAFYEPTLLEIVPVDQKVSCQEVFGPVAVLHPFENFKDALDLANQSEFGIQAGVFTNSFDHAFLAFNELEVGGVVINDVPSFRVDSMPYGGVKNSGIGREGVRFAMEEMSDIRLMVITSPA